MRRCREVDRRRQNPSGRADPQAVRRGSERPPEGSCADPGGLRTCAISPSVAPESFRHTSARFGHNENEADDDCAPWWLVGQPTAVSAIVPLRPPPYECLRWRRDDLPRPNQRLGEEPRRVTTRMNTAARMEGRPLSSRHCKAFAMPLRTPIEKKCASASARRSLRFRKGRHARDPPGHRIGPPPVSRRRRAARPGSATPGRRSNGAPRCVCAGRADLWTGLPSPMGTPEHPDRRPDRPRDLQTQCGVGKVSALTEGRGGERGPGVAEPRMAQLAATQRPATRCRAPCGVIVLTQIAPAASASNSANSTSHTHTHKSADKACRALGALLGSFFLCRFGPHGYAIPC